MLDFAIWFVIAIIILSIFYVCWDSISGIFYELWCQFTFNRADRHYRYLLDQYLLTLTLLQSKLMNLIVSSQDIDRLSKLIQINHETKKAIELLKHLRASPILTGTEKIEAIKQEIELSISKLI